MARHLYFRLLVLSLFVLGTLSISAQSKPTYTDGPYLRYVGDHMEVLYLKNGELSRDSVTKEFPFTFDVEGLPRVEITSSIEHEPYQEYTASKYIAISDVHGQYDVMELLLQQHGVIDSSGHWQYGDGHLIIVGDMLDRGDKVTEVLWLVYQLEQEAAKAGGKVHVLLGNHELMVMEGDIGYINVKYRIMAGISQVSYPDLFGKETFFGQWLRSKPISVKVNGDVFVHGGFSPEVLKKESSLEKLNETFTAKVIDNSHTDPTATDLGSLLYFDNGPLWYRGYANPRGFDEGTADDILTKLKADRIIVGHTSMPRIVSIHGGKIVLVDSSIKFGKSGEVLIYETDSLFRGMFDGTRTPISTKVDVSDIKSPFEYVYELGDSDLTIILNTNLGKLFGDNREKKEYQDATLTAIHNLEFNREWDIRLKTRGNMRKKTCRVPPLKIDFSKTTLDYLGFTTNDKLKLVLPCGPQSHYQQAVYREHVIYKLYQVIDSVGFRSHLVNVILENKGKEKYNFTGYFIEDKKDFASRTGAQLVENGVVRPQSLHRESYLKMAFFQFMILNTDYAVSNKHNLEIVLLPGEKRTRAIPYDFDYAGIINNDYAVPHSSLPINDVRDPYFRGYEVSIEEVEQMRDYFSTIRENLESIVTEADYLTAASKRRMLADISTYYDVLADEKKWESTFTNPRK